MDYEDSLIAAGPDGLEIRLYTGLLQTKRIPYSEIRSVARIPIGQLRRWRLWGTTIPGYWFNLDIRRPRKSAGFVIDVGRAVKPVVTPDDPDRFAEALRSHGVRV